MPEQQCTAHVLMVRPAGFCANPQTAASNRFQSSEAPSNSQTLARKEFDVLAATLDHAGVTVHSIDDTPTPLTPDAIFPNNWVSFHGDGSAVLYPMLAANRRAERRSDILDTLGSKGFAFRNLVDLTHYEQVGQFLEGTGSLVLDRVQRIAYACVSPRTHTEVLTEFAAQLDYQMVLFRAADQNGYPIYHTNVLLSIGRQFAVVCSDAIHADDRERVLGFLRTNQRQLILISHEQMSAFAANLLELATSGGHHVVAMSERAAAVLTVDQRRQLLKYSGPLVVAAIPTIETVGGGSVRCMLAEIHLPRT
jgi:hypothetical protein